MQSATKDNVYHAKYHIVTYLFTEVQVTTHLLASN